MWYKKDSSQLISLLKENELSNYLYFKKFKNYVMDRAVRTLFNVRRI